MCSALSNLCIATQYFYLRLAGVMATVVSQSFIGRCQIFHYDKIFGQVWSPISDLSVAVAVGFSNWRFATWI